MYFLLWLAGIEVDGDEASDETSSDADDEVEVETLPDVSGTDSGVDVGLTDEKLTKEGEE